MNLSSDFSRSDEWLALSFLLRKWIEPVQGYFLKWGNPERLKVRFVQGDITRAFGVSRPHNVFHFFFISFPWLFLAYLLSGFLLSFWSGRVHLLENNLDFGIVFQWLSLFSFLIFLKLFLRVSFLFSPLSGS